MTELEASNNAVLYYGVRTMAKMNAQYAREVPDLVGGVEERADPLPLPPAPPVIPPIGGHSSTPINNFATGGSFPGTPRASRRTLIVTRDGVDPFHVWHPRRRASSQVLHLRWRNRARLDRRRRQAQQLEGVEGLAELWLAADDAGRLASLEFIDVPAYPARVVVESVG